MLIGVTPTWVNSGEARVAGRSRLAARHWAGRVVTTLSNCNQNNQHFCHPLDKRVTLLSSC